MTAAHGAQLLKLALTIKIDLPHYEHHDPRDLVVEVRPGATVQNLTDAVIRHLRVQTSADPGLLRIIVRDGDGPAKGGARYLPRDATLADCELVDGVMLHLADPVADPAPDLFVDTAEHEDDLYLIDERGTHRGRVTRLPEGEPVLVGTNPPDDRSLLVDDLTVAEHAITLINRTGVSVECKVINGEGLHLSGAPSDGRAAFLLPGSTLTFKRQEIAHAGFVITTRAGLHGRSPVGRVQFDVAARLTDPIYDALPERVANLRPQPERPEPPPFPYEQVAVPLLIVGVLTLVMHSFLALIASPLAVVFPVANHIRQLRQGRRRYAKERAEWKAKLSEASRELAQLAGQEELNLRVENPAPEVWARRAYRRLAGLWGRDPQRDDFLRVRLGLGQVPSRYAIRLAEGTDTADADFTQIIAVHGRKVTADEVRPQLADAPVTVSLRDFHLGLAGPLDLVDDVATDILIQVACAHPPGMVGIAALLPSADPTMRRYEWLKWLPHTRAGSALLPSGRVLSGRQDGNTFLTHMRELHQERKQHRGGDASESYAVLVVHEAAEVDVALLSEVCELADGLVRVLWLGSTLDNAPRVVTSLVVIKQAQEASGDAEGRFHSGDQVGVHGAFSLDLFRVPPTRTAHALAALYDPRSSGASAGVPQSAPLSAVIDVEEIDYPARPREEIGGMLTAPIGLSESGLLELDLVRDGPHMLIGGTTGSGKSELLQTLTCSLVSHYSPDEVSLFLVDFKGGATFAPFRQLPHVIGYVTDLDQRNVNRALNFLRAELRRRETAFEEMNHAKEYADYLREALATRADGIIPRLVVVFDEFATIVKDFGKETIDAVIDIARRGRSWGVHLILATQQPSRDVVVPQVRGNVNARIALRTVSPEDSLTIIDRPEAARIPRALPGRALVSLDGNRLIEFQTAHSGAPFVPHDQLPPVTVAPFIIERKEQAAAWAQQGSALRPLTPLTQLQAVVTRVDSLRWPSSGGVRVLAAPLEEEHPRRAPVVPAAPAPHPTLSLGIRDLPHKQSTDQLMADLSRGGLCVVGPNRSGLTSTLVTVAETFARQMTADGRALVCFDGSDQLSHDLSARFANVVSMPLTRLDYVTRCVDQLWLTMRARMANDHRNGSGSYHGDYPVLLLIDGFDLLARSFAASSMGVWASRLSELLTLGRRQGIYTCITARRLRDIETSVAATQANVIVLHGQYEGTSVPQEERLAGLGVDSDGNLLQIYFPPEPPSQPSDIFPRTDLTAYLEPEGWRRGHVARPKPASDLSVTLGVDELHRRPFLVNLSESHVMLVGGPRSDRTALLLRLADELAASARKTVAMFSPRGIPGGTPPPAVRLVTAEELLSLYRTSRDERPAALAGLGCASLRDGRLVLLIDDSYAIESMDNGSAMNALLDDLYKHSQVQPVAVTAAPWVNSSQLTYTIKNSGVTVYLRPAADRSEFDDGYRVRGLSLKHRPGIVYKEGDALVQTDEGQFLVHLPSASALTSGPGTS